MAIALDALLLVLLVAAILVGFVLVLFVQRLIRLQWRTVHACVVAGETIPVTQRHSMDVAGDRLEQIGFVYRFSASANKAVILPNDEPSYFDVYQHAEGHTHVLVSLAPEPSAHDACMLQFCTGFEDGSNWLTLNRCRHFSPMAVAHWQVFDDYLPQWEQALQRHLSRVQAAKSSICADTAEFQRRLFQSFTTLIPDMVARGDLVPRVGSDFFRLSLMAAVRFALMVMVGRWRAAQAVAGITPPSSTNPEATAVCRAETDLQIFQNQLALRRTSAYSARAKWILLAVTAALFLVIGGLAFSWSYVPILLAVIALHEGGHYLAMKLTGYRNVSVFFLPGLGGLATGEKYDASPLEKLAVFLAGPVPGLILAGAAFWLNLAGIWAGPGWLFQLLVVSLIINYFNLLPIVPLDGGRVLEAMVFARLPRLRLVFTVICCVALFVLGVWLDEMVLKLVAVLLALGLPQNWRLMHLDLAVRRENDSTKPVTDETLAAQAIFSALQAPRFQAWSFSKRAAAAMALLPELLGRKPRIGESAFGMVLYLMLLLAPIAAVAINVPNLPGVIAAFAPTFTVPADDVDMQPRPTPKPPEPDWYAQIAKASALSADQLLSAYLGAAERANAEEETTLARKYYLKAWDLAQKLPLRDLRRIDAMEGLFSTAESDAEGDDFARLILSELAHPQGAERERVARIKEQLSYRESSPERRVQLLKDAVALRTEAPDMHPSAESSTSLHYTQLSLAKALDANRDPSGAQAVLQQRIDSLAPAETTDRSRQALDIRIRRVLAQADFAWFLMAHGRAGEALAVGEQARQALPPKTTVSWVYPAKAVWEVLVWAQLLAPPTASLATYWQRYESAQRDAFTGGRKLLYQEVDRALVAQALADAAMMAQAKSGVDEARAVFSERSRGTVGAISALCKPVLTTEGVSNWRMLQSDARRQMLTKLGACAPL